MATVLFDVNETMSDLTPIGDTFAALGVPREFAATWFAGTLRDGLALAVHGSSAPFADIGRAVARGMLTGLVPEPDEAAEKILGAFTTLALHPDIAPGVAALRAAGHRLVTLSNGAASVAEGLLERAGLRAEFDLVLTVADAGVWKPNAQAYRYAARRCGGADIVLVAVHPWDLDGAHRAGLSTAWLDRTGAPWPTFFTPPDHHVSALPDLADALT